MFSPVRHWLNLRTSTPKLSHRNQRRRRLMLECLEAHIAPAVFTVANNADSGAGSLRQAILDAATNGVADTIDFSASLAGQTITLTSNDPITAFGPTALVINADNITIDGSAAPKMQISGANAHRVFALSNTATLTLKNIWIANGRAQGGDGGTNVGATSTATNGGGGGAGMGGAIYNFGGTLNLVQSTLSGNIAQGGNGGNGSTWLGSYAGGGGGSAGGSGGNIVVSGNNTAGGGAGVSGPGGNGVAGTGGLGGPNQAGAQAAGGANGTLGGGGGGATVFATPGGSGLAASTISGFGGGGGGSPGNNVGGAGGFGAGGGASAGFSGNAGAGGFGGGGGGSGPGAVGASGFAAGVGGHTGSATGGGGGGAGLGGAIFNNGGIVTITNSTLTGNTAAGGAGGGSFNSAGAFVGTFAGAGAGVGGAVLNRNGTLTILNSTLSLNAANGAGRGVYNLGDAATATATINNAIIGQNDLAGNDFAGATINGGSIASSGVGNLIRNVVNFSGSIASAADPLLGAFNFYGGPTPTILPNAGSPVINLGNNAVAGALTTDQMGSAPRFFGTIDIGALERQPPTISAGTILTYGAPTTIRVGFGTPEPTVSVWGGSLPGGVTISSTGVLSGTPTTTGTFNFNVDASNGIGPVVTQAFSLFVNPADTTTLLTTSNGSTVTGQVVTFTATVTANAPSTAIPTGIVSFFDGPTLLGTNTLSGGSATFTSSSLLVGGHDITTVLNASSNFAISFSNTVSQQVSPADTTTVLDGSGSPTNFGQSAALRATILVNAPGGGTPNDGLVQFFDETTGETLGFVPPTNGVALFNTTALTVGSHDILAFYFASSNYNFSVSNTWTQQVNGLPTLSGVPSLTQVDEQTSLSFTATETNAGPTPVFSLIGEPAGATIDPDTGEFNWTPTEAQGPKSYAFTVRLVDGVTTSDKSITVQVGEVNVAPVLAGVPATATTAPGSPLTFTATATDADLINGLGNTLTFSLVGAPVGASIDPDTGAFTWTPGDADQPGDYIFKVRVQDDGVPSSSVSKTIKVTVQPVALVVSGDLLIGGTAGVDKINVSMSKDLANLVVKSGTTVIGTFPVGAVTGRIIVHGLGGNDKIVIDKKVTKPADLYGEAGNDALTGGSGNDRLFGGNGNDTVTGGLGNDLLVGGAGKDTLSDAAGINLLFGGSGADKLTGGTGEDLLVAGATTLDTDLTGLMHVFDEWTSGDTYGNRIAHLTGSAGGLNQGTFLTAATVPSDVEKDTLNGKKGQDWYIIATGDVVSGFEAGETKTTI